MHSYTDWSVSVVRETRVGVEKNRLPMGEIRLRLRGRGNGEKHRGHTAWGRLNKLGQIKQPQDRPHRLGGRLNSWGEEPTTKERE